MHQVGECSHCGFESRCRKREFSDQAWAALVVWKEIKKEAVGSPFCDSCYEELREILIERADDLANVAETKKTKGPKRVA